MIDLGDYLLNRFFLIRNGRRKNEGDCEVSTGKWACKF